ncbi:MAG: D-alanine--D-alanine ligase [Oscillospiraceae bacterium]|jgi:D-alanine-D-alanine ligase|nr:D-alanine--D-alanine ligase [Oscillospiraceae bacterium]
MKKTVAIVFGGVSSEHKISLTSAFNVLKNISEEKYSLIKIGIKKNGTWMKFDGPLEEIKTGAWENYYSNKKVVFSNDPTQKGLIVLEKNKISVLPVDTVFPILHGKNGEDGKLQAALEMSNLAYVGCGSVASANCMDKAITDALLKNSGIRKAKLIHFFYSEFLENKKKIFEKIEKKIGSFPIFVKPARGGSSIGINKAKDKESLKKAIEIAANEDEKICIEENIIGKELECAVLGNRKPFTSIIGRIVPKAEFYNFKAKYEDDTTILEVPAQIEENICKKIQNIAIKAYKIMNCKGLSRIDFFLQKKDNAIILNEINTMPGFTDISMYIKLMEKSFGSCSSVLDKLIDLSFESSF